MALLTPSLQEVKAAQLLGDYRLTPATLMAKIDPNYIASKWVLYLSYKIAMCIAKGSCGLLISAPPRHGKSMLATEATPLWVLENFPDYNVVVTTYGSDLSTDFALKTRQRITDNSNILSCRLNPNAMRIDNFLTTKGGGLKSVGLRGAITGRGANVFILDDYIKEPKEAMSAQYLEDLWTWYQTVARTRLEPGAVIIIVATRWVKNDIHGRIMDMQKRTGRQFFEYVTLPALALDAPEPGKHFLGYPDALGRAPGEPLFPERYTAEAILDIKTELTSRWFEAMFQQNPQGDEGSAVDTSLIDILPRVSDVTKFGTQYPDYKTLQKLIYTDPGRFVIVRYWDMASSKDMGDYTVGARSIYDKKEDYFVTDSILRGQLSAGKAEAFFKNTAETDLQVYPQCQFGMEREPGSSGVYSIRHFQEILASVRPGLILTEHPANKSKLLNNQPYLAAVEHGKTALVEEIWNSEYLDELGTFPEGLHDDQVDGVGGSYRQAKGLVGKSATWGRSNQVAQLRQSILSSGQGKLPAELANKVSLVWGREVQQR